MHPETGDHFVEDQRGVRLLGDLSEFAQEFLRLQIQPPALHRFHQHRRDLLPARAQDVQRLRVAVIENDHVVQCALGNARRNRRRTHLAIDRDWP